MGNIIEEKPGSVWRPIPGFEHFGYEASDRGQVRRPLKSGKWRVMKGHLTSRGYYQVHLRRWLGDGVVMQVARAMLLAFVGEPPDDGEAYEAAHNDGDPQNNVLDNLRWATKAENQADRKKHGTWGRKKSLTYRQAEEIRAKYTGEKGQQIALAEEYDVDVNIIWFLLNGRTYRRKHGVTPEEVVEIRARVAAGRWGIQARLAKEYRVSQGTINKIVHGRTYADID